MKQEQIVQTVTRPDSKYLTPLLRGIFLFGLGYVLGTSVNTHTHTPLVQYVLLLSQRVEKHQTAVITNQITVDQKLQDPYSY